MNKHLKIRNLKIATMYLQGSTFKSVGEKFKISDTRVRQIYFKLLRLSKQPKYSPDVLDFTYNIKGYRENKDYHIEQITKVTEDG